MELYWFGFGREKSWLLRVVHVHVHLFAGWIGEDVTRLNWVIELVLPQMSLLFCMRRPDCFCSLICYLILNVWSIYRICSSWTVRIEHELSALCMCYLEIDVGCGLCQEPVSSFITVVVFKCLPVSALTWFSCWFSDFAVHQQHSLQSFIFVIEKCTEHHFIWHPCLAFIPSSHDIICESSLQSVV